MFRISKVIAPAALAAGIVGATFVVAQPPDRKGSDDKQPVPGRKGPDDRKGAPDRRPPAGEPGERPAPKPDAAVDAWVKVLLEKIADQHDTVRDSARAALVHVGPQAIPALKQLAEGNDNVKAVAARNVIAMIERGNQPGRGPGRDFGGFGGQPGFPGQPFPGGQPGQPGQPPGREPGNPPGERPGPGGPGAERNPLGRILGDLNLTERQEKQVREIVEAHGKKMMEFHEKLRDGKIDPKDAREGLEKLRGELGKELKPVLNDEQMKRFEALMQRGPGGPGERPANPPRPGERPEGRPAERPGERPEGRPAERPEGRPGERPAKPDRPEA